ncbi:MAG: hypothetical protein ACYCXZ_01175 [Coriobacteriia bacterium]
MATKLWQKLQDGSLGTRVLSAYLAVVLMVSIVGPGLSVHASEGDVPSGAPVEVDQEVAPEVVAPVETEPAEKAAPVESQAVDSPAPPIVEPEVLPLGAPQASPEPSVESPLTALAVMPAASVTPVLSGHHNPPLVAGGVRIENPKTKTYKLSDVEIKNPVPYDFSISLQVFEKSTGWYLSFSSNYPISKVVMKGGSGGANIYSYSPAVFADSLLHTPANPNGKWAGVSHVDFYFGPVEAPKTGGVLVHKFLDENRNGEFDEGEKMLEGWIFTLRHGQSDPISGVTGPNGKLLFSGLAPGDYDVTETLEEGWISTTGLTQSVEVVAGQTAHLWFGNAPELEAPKTGDILVHKFLDENRNGEFDEGEKMLEGWTFTLSSPIHLLDSEFEPDSGVTGPNGKLLFSGLAPGDYDVTETLEEGWTSTTGLTQGVKVVAGQTAHLWFGNAPELEAPKTGGVLVHKFLDENRNGEFDEGEEMLEGWTFTLSSPIHLLDSEFEPDSGVTGPNGKLLFSGLAPGDYDVTETLEEGWISTTGLTQNVEVVAGQTAHVWFGNAEEFLPFTELDLAITKAVNVRTVQEGQLVTYTLTYWNLGDLPASNYSIVDDYDERYMTVVNASGGTVSGGKITWIFPGPLTKEAGKQTLTYTMRVVNSLPDSRTNIGNVVVISHPLDENLANNTDAERVIFTPEDPFLPFTGGEYLFIILTALIASVAGLALRMKPQAS